MIDVDASRGSVARASREGSAARMDSGRPAAHPRGRAIGGRARAIERSDVGERARGRWEGISRVGFLARVRGGASREERGGAQDGSDLAARGLRWARSAGVAQRLGRARGGSGGCARAWER